MSKTYGLYQTFSQNTPEDDLSEKEKKELKDFLLNLELDQKKAVFFLIIEHAIINDNFSYDPKKQLELPYDLLQNEKNLEFNLENLPINLKWILWKFHNMIFNQHEK